MWIGRPGYRPRGLLDWLNDGGIQVGEKMGSGRGEVVHERGWARIGVGR